jgi:hypothetical protein
MPMTPCRVRGRAIRAQTLIAQPGGGASSNVVSTCRCAELASPAMYFGSFPGLISQHQH